MDMIERELEEILTKNPQGVYVKIVHLQQFHDMTAVNDSAKRWIAGLARFETKEGIPVNQIDESTFEIVGPGTVLKRINPDRDSYLSTT